ncbi:hypothetical protein L596_006314 [Steinernema carpocapsae]|uniref:Uncharacterized protein n=1 Tax=Steinernema carpocapsae TaxID=34508 RepID=A0A4U8V809_STECR|nr:hypothetical protein L596_006314 [Steinernema carpocapsae]
MPVAATCFRTVLLPLRFTSLTVLYVRCVDVSLLYEPAPRLKNKVLLCECVNFQKQRMNPNRKRSASTPCDEDVKTKRSPSAQMNQQQCKLLQDIETLKIQIYIHKKELEEGEGVTPIE